MKPILISLAALLAIVAPFTPRASAGSLDAPPDGKKVTICGHVLQKVGEGMLVSCAEDVYERKQIPGAPGKRVIGAEVIEGGVVLLKGYPKEAAMADHDVIANVVARDTGTVEYTSEAGTKKTVHAYQFVTGH